MKRPEEFPIEANDLVRYRAKWIVSHNSKKDQRKLAKLVGRAVNIEGTRGPGPTVVLVEWRRNVLERVNIEILEYVGRAL